MPLTTDQPARLRSALCAIRHPWQNAALEVLPDKGLTHHHVRLVGTGALARIPKQSQLGLSAPDNLAYQQACFMRGFASGATPRYLGCLPPSSELPRGALLVQEIVGHPLRLPHDLKGMARALAALHAMPLPPSLARAPLLDAADPLAALLNEINAQTVHLPAAVLDRSVEALLTSELDWLRALCAQPARPERRFIAFDAHPGNFVVDEKGAAVLVDLEKCRYSYPGLDLAHATLYTSTTWDAALTASLTVPDLIDFYATWSAAAKVTAGGAGTGAQAWHVPLRRAMWLWSITWCAKWRVLSVHEARAIPDGEDWAAARSDAALVRHVRERVDHYLSPDIVRRVLKEFAALEEVWIA